MTEPWLLQVESGLSAHFRISDGSSRLGVQWVISLKQSASEYRVLVKALFANGVSQETIADKRYQATVAIQYLNDRLSAGWHPEQQMEHTIYVNDPR